MVSLAIRTHPDVIFAYVPNHTEVILHLQNDLTVSCWAEADVSVAERLSLSPDTTLRRGRIRMGILERNQGVEKSVRIYANPATTPQMYRCKFTIYVYNKEGVIESRMEKPIDIRCEQKKEAVL